MEKKITSLESERQTFNRSKSSSIYKFEDITQTIESNTEMISRMTKDHKHINSVIKVDKDGEKLNLIQLEGVNGSDIKAIGVKLNYLSDNARTNGEYFKIGELYGFKLLVKTEESQRNGSMFRDNRFFIEGEGSIKYNYNNGHIAYDPKLASMNFLNALDKIPGLIEKYQNENTRLSKDLPILQEVMNSIWKKENDLKDLKLELNALDRKVQLTLSSKKKPRTQKQK